MALRRRFGPLPAGLTALRRKLRGIRLGLALGLAITAMAITACSSSGEEPAQNLTDAAVSAETASTAASTPAAGSYVLFNQRLIEGFRSDGIDLTQPDSVFVAVFDSLPDEVTVLSLGETITTSSST